MMKEEAWFDGSAGGDVAIDIDGNSGLHERGPGARGARGASSSSTTSSAQPNAFEGLQDKIVYEVAGRMFQQAQTQAGGYMNLTPTSNSSSPTSMSSYRRSCGGSNCHSSPDSPASSSHRAHPISMAPPCWSSRWWPSCFSG